MLALAGALMTRPQLLLIDELSLGPAPTIVAQLLDVVREVHRRGTTVVIVEHHLDLVASLATTVSVLEQGRVIASGPAESVFADERVLRAYMGSRPVASREVKSVA